MTIQNDDFLAAVPSHLVGGLLKQVELYLSAIGDGARLVSSFEYLAKIIFGKNDSVFLVRGMQRRISNIEKISSKRKMWSMLFQNAKGQQASLP